MSNTIYGNRIYRLEVTQCALLKAGQR